MSAKKLIKVNPSLQDLLNEVSGSNPARSPENVISKHGDHSDLLKLKPAAKINSQTKKSVEELCKQREKSLKIIEEQKDKVSKIQQKLESTTAKYGRNLLDKPKDRVIYAEPYKTHLVWKETAGVIEAEAVAKVFPELIDSQTEKIDLSRVEEVLNTYEVPNELKNIFNQFKKLVEGLEKSTGQNLIEKDDRGLLNLEKYELYKAEGKITSKMLSEFETREGHYSLVIDKLVDKNRCKCCGFPRPKNSLNSKNNCTRCGG